MKLPVGFNKWGAVVLGVAILALVANLVAQYRDMQPQRRLAPIVTSRSVAGGAPSASPRRAGKTLAKAVDDLAQYDPNVHFDTLKTLDSRPLPDDDKDPFIHETEALAPVAQAAVAAPAEAPQPPPPPPPPPIKAMGYNELPGGKKEAMITFNDDMIVAHEGDTIGSKFKVITIDPTKVVVEDGETHQTLDLPFPQ